MKKIVEIDPLLDMLRTHANDIKEWDEEDKNYFCTNWDLCRDKLMELDSIKFEEAEKLMHDFFNEKFEIFKETFCAPHLLAKIILEDIKTGILELSCFINEWCESMDG